MFNIGKTHFRELFESLDKKEKDVVSLKGKIIGSDGRGKKTKEMRLRWYLKFGIFRLGFQKKVKLSTNEIIVYFVYYSNKTLTEIFHKLKLLLN